MQAAATGEAATEEAAPAAAEADGEAKAEEAASEGDAAQPMDTAEDGAPAAVKGENGTEEKADVAMEEASAEAQAEEGGDAPVHRLFVGCIPPKLVEDDLKTHFEEVRAHTHRLMIISFVRLFRKYAVPFEAISVLCAPSRPERRVGSRGELRPHANRAKGEERRVVVCRLGM